MDGEVRDWRHRKRLCPRTTAYCKERQGRGGKEASSMAGVGRSHLASIWEAAFCITGVHVGEFYCHVPYDTISSVLYTIRASVQYITLSIAHHSTVESDVLTREYHFIPSQRSHVYILDNHTIPLPRQSQFATSYCVFFAAFALPLGALHSQTATNATHPTTVTATPPIQGHAALMTQLLGHSSCAKCLTVTVVFSSTLDRNGLRYSTKKLKMPC